LDAWNHYLKGTAYFLVNKFGFVGELGKPKRINYTRPKFHVLRREAYGFLR